MPPVSRRLSSETMGLSEGIINNSQQSPRHLTRSRVEDILGSSTDEKIDKLLAALEVEHKSTPTVLPRKQFSDSLVGHPDQTARRNEDTLSRAA